MEHVITPYMLRAESICTNQYLGPTATMQNVAEVSDVSARFIEAVDVQCRLCLSDTAVSERNTSAVIMTRTAALVFARL